MSKILAQTIKELIKNGEEINVAELAEMVDLIDDKTKSAIKEAAPKNQKMTFVRNLINSTIRSEGFKVLNTRRNTYKAVSDYQDRLKYRKKRTDRIYKDYNEVMRLDEDTAAQGIPIPVEFFPEMEVIALEVEKTNRKAREAVRASQ